MLPFYPLLFMKLFIREKMVTTKKLCHWRRETSYCIQVTDFTADLTGLMCSNVYRDCQSINIIFGFCSVWGQDVEGAVASQDSWRVVVWRRMFSHAIPLGYWIHNGAPNSL
jgi:hypothetical protein